MGFFAELGSSILLFCLVFGMSATVDIGQIRKQAGNWKALLIGISLQFLILPFFGFCVVKILNLPATTGIILMVITSSPGGSYSNLWCSLWNAELALSVTMTACSTILSTLLLPANLILYTRWTYSSAVVKSLDWAGLFVSLIVVIGGITCGLVSSLKNKTPDFHRKANLMGNVAGISLIILSATVSSSDHQASLWDQDPAFYIGVALPAACGLAIASYLATKCGLEKPERVAVAVEGCYQNTGIATSVAITMFAGNESDLATAIGVPLYYGIVEATLLAIYCVTCWKRGWTKAPRDDNICKVLYHSYEVEEDAEEEEELAVEIVLGSDKLVGDLVFCQRDDGDYIIDSESLQKARAHPRDLEDHTDTTVGGSEHEDQAPASPRASTTRLDDPAQLSPSGTASSSSTESEESDDQKQSALGRTMTTIRARVAGYRPAAEEPRANAPVVPSVLSDESQESANLPARQYESLSMQSPTTEPKGSSLV